jgi:hypothetical protein
MNNKDDYLYWFVLTWALATIPMVVSFLTWYLVRNAFS